MSIASIDCFSVLLRDSHGSVTLGVLDPWMLAGHAVQMTKCMFQYVNCDRLARPRTALRDEFMGTTGRTHNAGDVMDGVVSMATFSIHYVQGGRSANGMGRFVASRDADSEVNPERHWIVHRIQPLIARRAVPFRCW
jgi:hypothetical protein